MKVLGLEFFDGPAAGALSAARGLCVFPSGPGLASLDLDTRYRAALLAADVRYVDSGFLTIAWFVLMGERLCRISGLTFLKAFISDKKNRSRKILWVHPSTENQEVNARFLEKQNFHAQLQSHYIAPMYPASGKIEDAALLSLIKENQPGVIIINLGSGVQEPLGAWLKQNVSYQPLILCTGGAIDFLTGTQVQIPVWVDKIFMGWLFRILATPFKKSGKLRTSPTRRYVFAWRLLWLVAKWRRQLPIA